LLLRVLVGWPLLVGTDLMVVLIAIHGLRRLGLLQLMLHLHLEVLLHVCTARWQGGCSSLRLDMRLMVVMLCCTPGSRARCTQMLGLRIAW
jgi:hypothetical protein